MYIMCMYSHISIYMMDTCALKFFHKYCSYLLYCMREDIYAQIHDFVLLSCVACASDANLQGAGSAFEGPQSLESSDLCRYRPFVKNLSLFCLVVCNMLFKHLHRWPPQFQGAMRESSIRTYMLLIIYMYRGRGRSLSCPPLHPLFFFLSMSLCLSYPCMRETERWLFTLPLAQYMVLCCPGKVVAPSC